MKLLDAAIDPEDFFGRLRRAPERILFVDYDGTLAPFHRCPERAQPYPRVAEALQRLKREGSTRIVVVSGRGFRDLRRPLNWIAHTEVWAAHGWERRTAGGERVDYEPHGEVIRQLALAQSRAARLERHGARIERKVASVAVHWRGLSPQHVDAVRGRLAQAWDGADYEALELLQFDCGMELRARGRNKGHAVSEVLAGSARGAACAYLGDDTTDEDAFAAVAGHGLAVLVRPALRQTCAHLWLKPPAELHRFLERWCDSCAA